MKMGIRAQLFIILTLISALPVLWLGLSAATEESEKALARDATNGLIISRSVARETLQLVSTYTQTIESLAAHAFLLHPWNTATVQKHLNAHASKHSGFSFMYVANEKGVSIACSPEFNANGNSNSGTDYSERDYFKNAKATRNTALSKVQIGKRSGVPNVQIGSPILDNSNNFLGITEGSVDLGSLQELVKEIASNIKHTRIAIVDELGHIVADSKEKKITGLRPVGQHASFIAPIEKSEYRVAPDDEGTLTRSTLLDTGVLGKNWTIVTMRPDAVVIADSERAREKTVRDTILVALLSLIAAGFISSILSAPIASLAQVAHNVTQGKKSANFPKIKAFHPEELGDLTDGFSQMLNALQSQAEHLEETVEERTHELMLTNQRLYMLAIAVEHAAEGIEIINSDEVIQYVNPAFTRITGYLLEDVGTPQRSKVGYGKENKNIRELLAGKNSWSGTRISTRKDGESYDEEITISALIGKSDEPHEDYFICIRRDITERKRLEAELRNKELSVLQTANEKLLEAAKSQRDFMATMSHELRTPLNAILGLAEILEEGIYGKLVSKQNEAVQTISNSGRHLLSLINDILEIRKIDAGHTSIKTTSVSATEIAQESLALARNTTKNKTITFETIISEQSNMVQADARRLKQILVNLLANAVKFTADGGTVSIEIKAAADPKMLDFLVADTGIGIAKDDLDAVFSPFFQVDSELARSYQGTGLGLALVTRFVNLHQGHISVKSKLGVGTVFTVSIPRVNLDASNTILPSAALPTIMTIEIEDILARKFENFRVNIRPQHTGFDAEEKVEAVQPDMIVISSPLADISSHQLVRQLKENPKTKHIPVVLVTNENESSASTHTTADMHLAYPLTTENCTKILEQLGAATTAIIEPERTESLILLVDDNPANIPHVRDYLVFKGCAVEIASNGEEAIAKVGSLRPDVVLMDIQMPGISGFTAIERLRENTDFDSVKIIAVTALASEEDRKKCISIGANDYLSKPFQLSVLCETIQKVLEAKV